MRVVASDYELIEASNPCQKEKAPATNAPAALGGVAASLAALQLKKALDGNDDSATPGQQITFCGLTNKLIVTDVGINPHCLCDHEAWHITPLRQSPERYTLGQALRQGRALSLPGKAFIRTLVCTGCGTSENSCGWKDG